MMTKHSRESNTNINRLYRLPYSGFINSSVNQVVRKPDLSDTRMAVLLTPYSFPLQLPLFPSNRIPAPLIAKPLCKRQRTVEAAQWPIEPSLCGGCLPRMARVSNPLASGRARQDVNRAADPGDRRHVQVSAGN